MAAANTNVSTKMAPRYVPVELVTCCKLITRHVMTSMNVPREKAAVRISVPTTLEDIPVVVNMGLDSTKMVAGAMVRLYNKTNIF